VSVSDVDTHLIRDCGDLSEASPRVDLRIATASVTATRGKRGSGGEKEERRIDLSRKSNRVIRVHAREDYAETREE